MRHIVHADSAPDSLRAEFRANPHPLNPKEAWEAFDARELRDHLWELQFGLCAYCERVLEPGPGCSSIEHIIPKTANPLVTFRYANLVLCCLDSQTCNLHKKGQHFSGFDATGRWAEGFVAPTQPRCETSFIYARDGSIDAVATDYQADTRETIRILNLNHTPLATERRDYLASIDRAVAAMADQLEAVAFFLRSELAICGLKPYFSAKRQLFRI